MSDILNIGTYSGVAAPGSVGNPVTDTPTGDLR